MQFEVWCRVTSQLPSLTNRQTGAVKMAEIKLLVTSKNLAMLLMVVSRCNHGYRLETGLSVHFSPHYNNIIVFPDLRATVTSDLSYTPV